ncbi:Calpain cysteine protease family protein [Babesia bovis T2Bo]|uniref:Calpain family cysteine protease domain containing protein n=1 Tax=Babesia bovis TaxID=5865 RepID=A7AP43_BABBO|nr:Calpain cysteine protease family protein [Babesia bovis T2Bo]EDO08327.1 Calpain cysteine protease family protein [Babesia bovis T2Bo]|eukprot:XP_001611895.1 calpain family cysteine protease domain containing protein [Babesia bovis T2Bo]
MAADGCFCFGRISGNAKRSGTSRAGTKDFQQLQRSTSTFTSLADPVVLGSSILGDLVAPPWHSVTIHDGPIPGNLWEDPKGRPGLTSKQRKRLGGWIHLFDGDNPMRRLFTAVPSSARIKQGFVADCSFLSALSSLADYGKKHCTSLLTNIIKFVSIEGSETSRFGLSVPVGTDDSDTAVPKVAIGVKLYFNGVARCILVDDWVPVRSDGRFLSAHSVDRNECWVTVLEKAFVKLNGGRYTIRGTNPGIDTYHLTGWIPDIITLPQITLSDDGGRSLEHYPEKWDRMWDVMYAGFCSGACVICLGTSSLPDAAPSGHDSVEGISVSSGIVSHHAYSVLDIKDVLLPDKSRLRLLYLKNPWGDVSWKQRFSPGDDSSWTKELCEVLQYTPSEKDNGVFWIEWNDVLRWYSHIYISWKPTVFRNRITLHQRWIQNPFFLNSLVSDDMHLSVFNPQFNLTVSFDEYNSATVWILLLQHRHISEEAHKYLAMHVFSREHVVICPPMPDVQGVYSNGECILLKLLVKRSANSEAPADHMLTGELVTPYKSGDSFGLLVLLSCYAEKLERDLPFTIKVLSSRPVELMPLPCLVKPHWYTTVICGDWNGVNSGGSPNNIWSYFMNPHYRLVLEDFGEVLVLLECSSPLSVNLRLFPGRIATPRALKGGKVVSSEDYKIHCCSIHRFLKGGQYVIIPSSFRPNERGSFRIVVYSKRRSSISLIPYPHCPVLPSPEFHIQRVNMTEPIHFETEVPTSLAVRIEVPTDIMSDFFAIFASSLGVSHPTPKEVPCNFQSNDNVYCLDTSCSLCGGPGSRFREITHEDPSQSRGYYDLVLYSDLNGGTSKNGRTPSASARHLFETERVVNFTLADILPSTMPYRLTALGGASQGVVTFTSDKPISIM